MELVCTDIGVVVFYDKSVGLVFKRAYFRREVVEAYAVGRWRCILADDNRIPRNVDSNIEFRLARESCVFMEDVQCSLAVSLEGHTLCGIHILLRPQCLPVKLRCVGRGRHILASTLRVIPKCDGFVGVIICIIRGTRGQHTACRYDSY